MSMLQISYSVVRARPGRDRERVGRPPPDITTGHVRRASRRHYRARLARRP